MTDLAPIVPTARTTPKIPANTGANVKGGMVMPKDVDVSRFSKKKRTYKQMTVPGNISKDVDLRYIVATPERIAEAEELYYKVVVDEKGQSKTLKSGMTGEGEQQKMILVGRSKEVTAMSNRERAVAYSGRRDQLSSKNQNQEDGAMIQTASSKTGFETF